MTKQEILADLRDLFGRKTMLTPTDLAEVIAQSPGAQAVARHRGRFDIPLRKRGRNVYVSIHDLADWLHRGENPDEMPEQKTESSESRRTARSPSSGLSSTPGKPRRASLGQALLFARRALDFDAELFAALEAKALTHSSADRKR